MKHDLKNAKKLKPLAELEEFLFGKESRKSWGEFLTERDDEKQAPINYAGEVLCQWAGPEFEVYEKSFFWYVTALAILFGLVVYALISNGPIMAITFILIGAVGYVHLNREPRLITFAITSKGVYAGKELYPWDNIESFWIFYEPPYHKALSLKTNASFFPHVHIPLGYENPVLLREKMKKFSTEEQQQQNMIDILERLLRI